MISSFLVLSLAFGGGEAGGGEGASPGPVHGWEMTDYSAHHTQADLHKYMDGGAAKYLAYSIQELHVQEYRRQSDGFTAVLELYRMDSPANAYGIYSSDRSGAHPDGSWQEGTYGAGLLQFWQGRYYARVQATDPSGDPEEEVLELGRAASKALASADIKGAPSDSHVPQLAAGMPEKGLVEDSLCFFHNQVSLNSIYYLSNKNLLNLSLSTDAVSALYSLGDGATARVVAICYPDASDAAAAGKSFSASSSVDMYRNPGQDVTGEPESSGGSKRTLESAGEGSGDREGEDRSADADIMEPPAGAHSIVKDRLLVIVIDAPSSSAAEELCARISAAVVCPEGGER